MGCGRMTLTKADLVGRLVEQFSLGRADAKGLVGQVFAEIGRALEQGDAVKLAGFGTFELRDKPPRPGRNPKTGDDCLITVRRVVTFKASPKLKQSIEVAQPPGNRECSLPRQTQHPLPKQLSGQRDGRKDLTL